MKYLLQLFFITSLIFQSGCTDDELAVPVVYGCTDSEATNFNSDATDDNGSCVYAPTIIGIWEADHERRTSTNNGVIESDLTYIVDYQLQFNADNTFLSDTLTGTYTYLNGSISFTHSLDSNTSVSIVDALNQYELDLITEYEDLTDPNVTWNYYTHYHRN